MFEQLNVPRSKRLDDKILERQNVIKTKCMNDKMSEC